MSLSPHRGRRGRLWYAHRVRVLRDRRRRAGVRRWVRHQIARRPRLADWLPMAAAELLVLAIVGFFWFELADVGPGLTMRDGRYRSGNDTTLTALRGQATVLRSDGQRVTVTSGPQNDVPVRAGDRVQTGANTSAVITYFDGSTTELEANTTVAIQRLDRLPGGGVHISLAQQVGQSWNRVERLHDTNGAFRALHQSAVPYVRSVPYRGTMDLDGTATIDHEVR